MSFVRNVIAGIGLFTLGWQVIFILLYFSSILSQFSSSLADGIMTGAAICGVLGAITCYFPHFMKKRIEWLQREGRATAASFVLLFVYLGISLLVVDSYWIGSM